MSDAFYKAWYSLCDNKPALHEPEAKIEITSEQLQKLCYQFYVRGGKDTALLCEQLEKVGKKQASRFDNLFEDIFGR